MQEYKLTKQHFQKDFYSRMKFSYATQILSNFSAKMVNNAINEFEIELKFENKEMLQIQPKHKVTYWATLNTSQIERHCMTEC